MNQRQARCGIRQAMQVFGRLGQDHFQGRAHVRFEQMSPMRRAIGFSQHDVRVNCRLLFSQRYVPQERQHFDLLVDRDLFVAALRDVEKAQPRITKGADGSELASAQAIFSRESFQAAHDLVTGVENDCESLRLFID